MTPLSIGLVLLSALAHSSWNLMLKKSDNQEVFIFYLLVVRLFQHQIPGGVGQGGQKDEAKGEGSHGGEYSTVAGDRR
jgi:hypothetical protein